MLQTCCCGCSLAHGTVGTGVVSVIESILYIALGSLFLEVNFSDDEDSSNSDFFYCTSIYYLVQGSLVIVASIFLFCAVKTKHTALLLPWLIVRGIFLVLGVLGSVSVLALGNSFILVGPNILWQIVIIYLYVVVFSYYQSDVEIVSTNGRVLALAPTTGIVLMPQQQQFEYQPLHNAASVPEIDVETYTAPNPTGQQFYPTQT